MMHHIHLSPGHKLLTDEKVLKSSLAALKFALFADAICTQILQPNFALMIQPGAHEDSFPDTYSLSIAPGSGLRVNSPLKTFSPVTLRLNVLFSLHWSSDFPFSPDTVTITYLLTSLHSTLAVNIPRSLLLARHKWPSAADGHEALVDAVGAPSRSPSSPDTNGSTLRSLAH